LTPGQETVLPALLSLATTGPFNSKVLFPYGSFPGSQVPSPSQVARTPSCGAFIGSQLVLRSLSVGHFRDDPRRMSPPIHPPLSPLLGVQVHAQTAQHGVAPVCRMPQTGSPAPRPRRGLRITTLWRGAGFTSQFELIDSEWSEIQLEPRFCLIRLRQRF
jgi:hypothetical protein